MAGVCRAAATGWSSLRMRCAAMVRADGAPPPFLPVRGPQCVGYSTVLDDMYRTERARLLAQMK